MKLLKAYEGFQVGDFKSFISKYKSKGYISRTDMKRMDASDMKFAYFEKILKKVNDSFDFFNSNDFVLLSDLMLDVYDDFPSIKSSRSRYSFGISYEDEANWSHSIKYIDVSRDETGNSIQTYGENIHSYLMDKEDVINSIISGVVSDRENDIKKTEYDIANPTGDKRPGTEDINISKLRSLKTQNAFKNLQIKTYLYIDIKIGDPDDYYSIPRSSDMYYMMENFKKSAKEQLTRYFSVIGYNNSFEIGCRDYYSTSFSRITVAMNI